MNLSVRNVDGDLVGRVTKWAGAVVAVSGALAALYWLPSNLVFAGDLEALHQSITSEMMQQKAEDLRDKILEIKNMVPEAKRTDGQRALIEHYESRIRAIDMREAAAQRSPESRKAK